MKNLIILLILSIALVGCQKEFPEAPDYSTKLKANLTTNWQIDFPEDEKVLFVFALENRVIYITKDDKKLHSYVLESSGEVAEKYDYSVTDLEYLESNRENQLISNWIQIISSTQSIFINPFSGELREVFASNENKPSSKLEYRLGKDNVCYYLEYTSENDAVCRVWNLESNEVNTLDTLEKNIPFNENSSFVFLGENENLHFRNNFSQHLVYLKMKYERGQDVYACSMVGISFDDFFGSKSWNSEVLFRTIHYDHETQPYLWDKDQGILLTVDKTLFCLDFMHHTVKWKKTLPSRIGGNIILSDSRAYFTVQDEKTYSIDATNGATVWSSGFGYAQNKIALEDGILAISGLRRIESEEILADAYNTLHLIDVRTGRELYRNRDPLQKGYSTPNDFRYGLTRAVVIQNKELYLADENQFLSFKIQAE